MKMQTRPVGEQAVTDQAWPQDHSPMLSIAAAVLPRKGMDERTAREGSLSCLPRELWARVRWLWRSSSAPTAVVGRSLLRRLSLRISDGPAVRPGQLVEAAPGG